MSDAKWMVDHLKDDLALQLYAFKRGYIRELDREQVSRLAARLNYALDWGKESTLSEQASELLEGHERQHYHTLGGLTMLALGQVPKTGDRFERGGFRFEIVDMDGHRVDRVLVSRLTVAAPPPGSNDE